MAYTEHPRTKLVTWICILGFILVVGNMPEVFSPATRKMGDFYPALFALIIALQFIAYVGLWYMKRWGVELFMIVFASQVIQSVLMESLNPVGVVYHIAVLISLIVMYRKMDRNL
jgi:hypothetical protein